MNAPGIAPIPLTRSQIELIQDWASNDRLWGSKAATETNLYTFARLILKHANDDAVGQMTCEGGVTVRWCPRCGTCTCPEQNGNPDRWIEDSACPIHGTRSDHAEPINPKPLTPLEAELLEALKGYKAVLSPWVKRPPVLTFEHWDAAVERIETAIAKAEGK